MSKSPGQKALTLRAPLLLLLVSAFFAFVRLANGRARQVLLGGRSKYSMRERASWFVLGCAVHGSRGLFVGLLARAFRGRARDPSWGVPFELIIETSRAVVRYGEQALWKGDPSNYTAVRKVMDLIARPALPLVCRLHGVRATPVRCTGEQGFESLLLESAREELEPGVEPVWVVYFHGGGYAAGSPYCFADLGARLVNLIEERSANSPSGGVRANVLLVRYSLAPERPYPAALEDAIAAYRWATARVGPKSVALAGDSAGGGLALATAMKITSLGLPSPTCVYTLSPMLELKWGADPHHMCNECISKDCIQPLLWQGCSRNYVLGGAAAPRIGQTGATARRGAVGDHFAAPALAPAEVLRALPPTLVQTGGVEIFARTARRLVDEQAHPAGAVQFQLSEWPGMTHCFQHQACLLPAAHAALEEGADFILSHAASSTCGANAPQEMAIASRL